MCDIRLKMPNPSTVMVDCDTHGEMIAVALTMDDGIALDELLGPVARHMDEAKHRGCRHLDVRVGWDPMRNTATTKCVDCGGLGV